MRSSDIQDLYGINKLGKIAVMHLCPIHFVNKLQAIGIITQKMELLSSMDFIVGIISLIGGA